MCRTILLPITLVSLLWLTPRPALGKDVFVAKDGRDSNPGTRTAPVATIRKAVAMMRNQGPGTIWIAPGEYFLQRGITLDGSLSGTARHSLVIRGTEPGRARLTGARRVTGFRPISAEEAKPLISEKAKRHVLVADLAAQGFPSLDPLPVQHRAHGCEEVVFGPRPMQSARWPNESFEVFTEVIDPGASKPVHWVRREVYRPGSFRFPNDRPRHWDFNRGVWLHGFWCYDWCDEVIKAASYNPKTGELRLAAKHSYGVGNPWKKNSKRRFYALHVFEELDRPGEYYLDRKQNRLYFWPPGDVTKTPVYLTLCREPLIRAQGVSHLVIRDLTFENGRDAAVVLQNCRHARVENCLIRNMGRNGIRLRGSHLAVEDCEIAQTGSYGISVYGGDRKTLTEGDVSVANCHIHHVGRLDWMSGRGVIVGGCGNRVANNRIHHGPTGAVSYGGNEHVLELNDVSHMCLYYSDVGVFYTGRDWCSRGNVVRWNYIHDIVNNTGHGSSAIYLDDCDSGDTVVGNIVFGGVGRGVLLGGGRDNTIHGNIFINLPIGIHVDARGPRGITLDQPGSWNLLAKCQAVGFQSSLWRKRYPRLARVMDEDPLMPRGNSIQNNILIGCRRPFAISKGIKDEWLGRKNNVLWRIEEVPFVADAVAKNRLDLARLSKLWRKVAGFEPIPVERIGPRRK